MLVSRLYLREVAGRNVYYPFGRVGAGYLVPTPQLHKIRRFMRAWVVCLAAVALTQIVGHMTSELAEELLVAFVGAYLVLATIYGFRVASYIRRLKVMPLQVDAE